MADFLAGLAAGPSVALGLQKEDSAAGGHSLAKEKRQWVVASGGYDRVTWIVIGYVASVVTSVAIMLVFLKTGW